MNDYLQGFNDGYKKAMEQLKDVETSVYLGGRKISKTAVDLEPQIALLQEEKKRMKRRFDAE